MQVDELHLETEISGEKIISDDMDATAGVSTPRAVSFDADSTCMVIERLLKVDHGIDFDTSEKNPIISVSSSPIDHNLIATGGLEGTIRLWKLTAPQTLNFSKIDELEPSAVAQVTTLLGHSGQVNAVRFSPDGKYLASASADGTARIYASHGSSWKLAHSLRFHTLDVTDLAWFSPSVVITTSTDRNTVVWDANTGGRTQTLYSDKGSCPKGLAVDPKGEFLMVLFDEGLLDIYRRNVDGKFRLTRHINLAKQDAPNYARAFKTTLYARRAAWTWDGQRLLLPLGSRGRYGPCGIEYDRFNLLDPTPGETLECKKVYAGHPSRVVVVSCKPGTILNRNKSEDPFTLSALVSVDGVLSIWASSREQPLAVIANLTGPLRVCTDATWAGDTLLLSSSDGSLTAVRLRNIGELIGKMEETQAVSVVPSRTVLPSDDVKSAQVEIRVGGKRKIQPVVASASIETAVVHVAYQPPAVLKSDNDIQLSNHSGKGFTISLNGVEVFKADEGMVSSLVALPDGLLLGCVDEETLGSIVYMGCNQWTMSEMKILIPGIVRHMTACAGGNVLMFTVDNKSLCVWKRDREGNFEAVWDDLSLAGLIRAGDAIESLDVNEAQAPVIKLRSGKELLFKPKIKRWVV